MRAVTRWLADRLQLSAIVDHLLHHPIPPGNVSRRGWWYVFGAGILAAFGVQVVTGIVLASKYIPSPAHAHDSLVFITEQATFGRLVRALHFFGASAMVLFVFVHAARVFLLGSYKFPRELTWITGVVLLGLTLAVAGTGQLLRWDQAGIWTVVVWAKFAARVPLVGDELARLILAGDTLGGPTLSRFFALHVLVFPALIALLVGLHLHLVLQHGISEPPIPGRPVDPATYRDDYGALLARGRPYWPDGAWREALVAGVVAGGIVLLAVLVGPKGPGAPPDPTDVTAAPKPDWFLLWYYALVWLKPPGLEALFMVYLPLGLGLALVLLPLVASRGERHPSRRPWAVAGVGLVVLVFLTLTGLGARSDWVPVLDTTPLGRAELGDRPPMVLAGAAAFHTRGCQYCHAVLGRGGRYGPELTNVAKRRPPEHIAAVIVNGVANMPAYRDILTTEELVALVAFLRAVDEG
jgi:ubiquinol-cytochrome c reductase cytochrome b subunit